MRSVLAACLVIGLLTGTATAKEGWKDLKGKRCPAFNVGTWLNTDGESPQPEDLVGTVWLLEFLSAG